MPNLYQERVTRKAQHCQWFIQTMLLTRDVPVFIFQPPKKIKEKKSLQVTRENIYIKVNVPHFLFPWNRTWGSPCSPKGQATYCIQEVALLSSENSQKDTQPGHPTTSYYFLCTLWQEKDMCRGSSADLAHRLKVQQSLLNTSPHLEILQKNKIEFNPLDEALG